MPLDRGRGYRSPGRCELSPRPVYPQRDCDSGLKLPVFSVQESALKVKGWTRTGRKRPSNEKDKGKEGNKGLLRTYYVPNHKIQEMGSVQGLKGLISNTQHETTVL